jgi:hypothetical protein
MGDFQDVKISDKVYGGYYLKDRLAPDDDNSGTRSRFQGAVDSTIKCPSEIERRMKAFMAFDDNMEYYIGFCQRSKIDNKAVDALLKAHEKDIAQDPVKEMVWAMGFKDNRVLIGVMDQIERQNSGLLKDLLRGKRVGTLELPKEYLAYLRSGEYKSYKKTPFFKLVTGRLVNGEGESEIKGESIYLGSFQGSLNREAPAYPSPRLTLFFKEIKEDLTMKFIFHNRTVYVGKEGLIEQAPGPIGKTATFHVDFYIKVGGTIHKYDRHADTGKGSVIIPKGTKLIEIGFTGSHYIQIDNIKVEAGNK